MTQIKTLNDEQVIISNLDSKGDAVEIEINKKILLRLSRGDHRFYFDFYKYATEEELNQDDYDYDGDFIDNFTLLDGQLKK